MSLFTKNFSAWYLQTLQDGDLVEMSEVRGCAILKPTACAIWEHIQTKLNEEFKKKSIQNYYFPLFIPRSLLQKEGQHMNFSKECAVVTNYRMIKGKKGNLIPDPSAVLEEPLVVRPTSESLIWNSYKKWITSYRDLPLLCNQWCNVVRWEMRCRPLLRTMEFLWQEGHTAHSNREEADEMATIMIKLYADCMADLLALPAVIGRKSERERFDGACKTYSLEMLMQDGKALQAGTSHFLGQNFARAFNVSFTDNKGQQQYVWGTSWGITTRLLGAMVMVHSDAKGLVLPAKVAPLQLVILLTPNLAKDEIWKRHFVSIKGGLNEVNLRWKLVVNTQKSLGWHLNYFEKKGVPLILILGFRELEEKKVTIKIRDNGLKIEHPWQDLSSYLVFLLEEQQKRLYKKALSNMNKKTFYPSHWESFVTIMKKKEGWAWAYWDGTAETEKIIQEKTKATIRCFSEENREGVCIFSGKPTSCKALFAQAY